MTKKPRDREEKYVPGSFRTVQQSVQQLPGKSSGFEHTLDETDT